MLKWKYVYLALLCVVLAACNSQATLTEAVPEPALPQENAPSAITDTAAPLPQEEAPSESVSYAGGIQPIFNTSCTGCHGNSGGLSLESYDQLMAGGKSGAVITAENPGESILVKRLTGEIAPIMPRGGSLPDEQINLIRQWIEEGALNN